MPTISVHIVRKPRKPWGCALCQKSPDHAPHAVTFGFAERGDKPYRIRICLGCASSSTIETPVFLAAMKFIGGERPKKAS